MKSRAENIAKAFEHYQTRTTRRPKQRFRKRTNDWVKVKTRIKKV